MDRKEKAEIMEELQDKLSRASGVYFTEYRGLSVAAMYALRSKLREKNIDYLVTRNNLVRIAMEKRGIASRDEFFSGPTGIAYDYGDGIDAAKVLLDFQKDNEAFVVKGGVLEGEAFGAEKVEAISKMPSKEEQLSMFVGALEGVIGGFVHTLDGVIGDFARTLDAVHAKMGEGGEQAAA